MSNSDVKRSRNAWIQFCQKWAKFFESAGYVDLACDALDGAELVKHGKPAQVKPVIEQWQGWLQAHGLTATDEPMLVFDN